MTAEDHKTFKGYGISAPVLFMFSSRCCRRRVGLLVASCSCSVFSNDLALLVCSSPSVLRKILSSSCASRLLSSRISCASRLLVASTLDENLVFLVLSRLQSSQRFCLHASSLDISVTQYADCHVSCSCMGAAAAAQHLQSCFHCHSGLRLSLSIELSVGGLSTAAARA